MDLSPFPGLFPARRKSLAKGGKDRFLNLQVTHKQCNLKKGKK
jgi:5-methylcytosine-specific restriction endonuclease McrA